ncbi:type I methionyl aminopeptidase [Leifsonia sp. P73]|uniref:type I methionyl aminopeptidase n=1 Tax=Leifsonia sp. P73 TaxID=3423959 RepID=UPI003DA62920
MPKDSAGHLVPGRVTAMRSVPSRIPRPEYVGKQGPTPSDRGDVYSPAEVELIRESGRIAARAIERVGEAVRPGITTEELDAIGHEFLIEHDAYPSTLGYRGYPKSICSSVNEVVCHGIPDDTVLADGDIVNIDITAYTNGFHGDSNQTFIVGTASQEVTLLVERTREALNRGIKAVAPGRQVNVIGRAIESYAKRFGYGVVRDFTGHGVGATFHSGLIIPHYDAAPAFDDVMEVGMVFTIEPMLTLGSHEWDLWADDWTVVTRDRSITAQFEHTLVVTERGAEVLTLPWPGAVIPPPGLLPPRLAAG